ncbi:hypothetical protein [Selenomonas ruminantium]|uniref:Uncharacterized protein n=1 Tax=Selenomonas ruminantium TaxID=971 RepID=A0A1I0VPM5_SELRU|nr:hypothetical protein [Selenomonas ruminantium]SFA77923.1 hypothetical protein SAMN05216587_101792 [Selenomonas ruminantium]
MLKEETKRKLRLMGVGEYIQAIELQDGDTAIYSLPFQEGFQLLTDSVYQQIGTGTESDVYSKVEGCHKTPFVGAHSM